MDEQDEGKKSEHILVVDDDEMNLRLASNILRRFFCVSFLKSGTELFSFLQSEIPDLILLDVYMPEMDGFDVIRQLKKQEEYKDIPVIFLTADDNKETEIEGFREGALDFITKPFITEIMLQRVGRMLELNRLRKNLQDEVERQTRKADNARRKIERLSEQTMRALVSAIDAKDKYTQGHSSRVAEYSREIARRLGKSESEQQNIFYIGLLHDVGKIGIPDYIINKDSELTKEEYSTVKSHTLMGANILKKISEMSDLEDGAHWHHERYDGTGYPDGKCGKDIPEVARIIGVADAYDAMTSNRSYRKALPQEVVREEIIKGKGTQFDPEITMIMLQMIEEDREYEMREF